MFQFTIHYQNYKAVPGSIMINKHYREVFKIYKDNILIENKNMSINSENTIKIKEYLKKLYNGEVNINKNKPDSIEEDTYEIYKNGKLIFNKTLKNKELIYNFVHK